MLTKPNVLFGSTKAWAVAYLKTSLTASPEPYTSGVSVRTDVGKTMPTRLVTIRDDGGPRLDDVRKVTSLGVNVWASDNADAEDLAALVVALLEASPGSGPVVAHVASYGPRRIVEESGKPHYYSSVDLSVRGVPLQ